MIAIKRHGCIAYSENLSARDLFCCFVIQDTHMFNEPEAFQQVMRSKFIQAALSCESCCLHESMHAKKHSYLLKYITEKSIPVQLYTY